MLRPIERSAVSALATGAPTSANAPSAAAVSVERITLGFILLVGLILRIHWAMILPYNDAPDEYCHWAMVRYLAVHHLPPTMADVPREVPVSYPAMSPVGYVPLGVAVGVVGADHPWSLWVARLTNACLGTLFLLLVHGWAREIPGVSRTLALLTTSAFAVQPQVVFTFAYVNNDGAMLLVAAGLWWVWQRWLNHAPTMLGSACAGFLGALVFLCKPNGLGIVAAGAPVMAMLLFDGFRTGTIGRAGARLAVLVLTAVATLLPWCAWSWYQHGSLFGLEIHRWWWIRHTSAVDARQGFLTLDTLKEFLLDTWETSWGCFGYSSVRLDDFDYSLVTLAFGVAIGSLVVQGRSVGWRWRELALLAGALLSVWLLHAAHSATFGLAAQGRYVLIAFWPMLLVLVAGWYRLGKSPRQRLILGFVPVLLIVGLQSASVEKEKASNRIAQPDRRVRARLVAFSTDLPAKERKPLPAARFVGDARMEERDGRMDLVTSGGGAIRWPNPVPASRCGALQVTQQWRAGPVTNGCARLWSVGDRPEVLAEIPYGDPCIGMIEFRFDFRKVTAALGEQMVTVEFQPSREDCRSVFRSMELLDRDFRPVVER